MLHSNVENMLEKHTATLFSTCLIDHQAEESALFSLLSPDEIIRAERFRLKIHRQRFIVTRGLLRKQLSTYTRTPPQTIQFSYQHNGKPALLDNPMNLHFNVSHSDDMAFFGFMLDHEIGVDIEKIRPHFNLKIAKRFFSREEYSALLARPIAQQANAFYAIWSAKEALIKAAGAGIFSSTSDFSVDLSQKKQTIFLHSDHYRIECVTIHPHYAAAIAVKTPTYFSPAYPSVWAPLK